MSFEKEIAEMKVKCKKRVAKLIGLIFIVNVLMAAQLINKLMPFANVTEHYASMLEGFQYGLIFGLLIALIGYMVYYTLAARRDDMAKQLYVKETDERNIMIKEKAGIKFFLLNIICMTIAAVISGYFSHIAFFTLVGTVYFEMLLMISLKFYWTKKL